MDSPTLAQEKRSRHAMKNRLNGSRGTKDGYRDSKGAEDGGKQCQVMCKILCKHCTRCKGCLCHGNSVSSPNRIKRKQSLWNSRVLA